LVERKGIERFKLCDIVRKSLSALTQFRGNNRTGTLTDGQCAGFG
jgi:hypothetical protein